MVLEFIINSEQWGNIKDNMLNNNTFEYQVWTILSSGTSAPQMSKIVLPYSVTTSERHKLHVLTRPGFKPESFGEYNQRYMVLNITKNYFEHLNDAFKPIEPEPEPEVQFVLPPPNRQENPIEALKKAILDDIMVIVEKHLNEQFLRHYT